MDTVRSQLEMLSDDSQGNVNFISWRFKLNLALKNKDLYEIVTGTKARPAGAESEANVSAWIKKDIEAQTLIGLNVNSKIATKIANCKTAKAMIDKLVSLYGTKTDVTLETSRIKFFTFEYDESKSAVENCMEIMDLAAEVSTEDDPLKESWIMTRILSVLPSKLAHFRTSWNNVTGPTKNLDTLIERLRLEDEQLKEMTYAEGSNTSNALMARREKQGRSSNSKQEKSALACYKCGKMGHVIKECKGKPCQKYIDYCKKKYTCNNCKKKGHFAKECPSRKEGNNQENGKSIRKAFLTTALSTVDFDISKDRETSWYQDCGASQHMTSHREWFVQLVELDEPIPIVIGDSTRLDGVAVGNIEMEAFDGQKWYPVVLEDVIYVPNLNFNLFSVSQMLDKGHVQKANGNESTFFDQDGKEIVAIAKRKGNLFKMMLRREEETGLMVQSIKVWHERLAHQNVKYVRDILKRKGIKYVDDWNNYVCTGCSYGKQHRSSHPNNPETAQQPLDLVHVDTGEMNIPSLGGSKYWVMFKDDFTHYRTCYFMKAKSETPEKIASYLRLVENQLGRRVKSLRSDNGTELKNTKTKEMMNKLGIFHTFTNVNTPEQNGRIERDMRTFVEAARAAIHADGLDERLWAEAMNYAIFTINQTGTSNVPGKSPAELWFGRKMKIEKLRPFGCECFVLKQAQKKGKIDRKSEKGILVGYDIDSPCYRIYLKEKREIVTSDNVIFAEEKIKLRQGSELETLASEGILEKQDESSSESDEEDENCRTEENAEEASDKENGTQPPEEEPRRRTLRDRRTLQPPPRLRDCVLDRKSVKVAIIGETENISVSEALKDEKWRQAMQEEYDSLMDMKTWELVDCPEGMKPITCRWVLREKTDGRYKARLVARGFEQKEGIDYEETFSPVARHASIRLLLSHAASEKMKLVSFDVKTAFLYGKLEQVIYMNQPEGFNDGSGKVCKLDKSLYGLKQAPRMWNERVTTYFEDKIGLINTDDDPCIYYNEDKSIMLSLFVDDGLIAGKDENEIYRLLGKISKEFQITFSKKLQDKITYLGMEIKIDQNGIFVNQPLYTEKILRKMKLENCNPASTPIEQGMVTKKTDFQNDEALPANNNYREAIGSLLYLATITRPDISFAVNYLSRFCNKPMKSHQAMVKRVFQYLRGTVTAGIHFGGDRELVAYTDSDFGGDSETGQSTSGVLVMRGGPVIWYSQKQRLVATSTAEAEYRAAVSVIDDVCWMKRMALELGILKSDQPITLKIDNMSAIHMLQNAHEGKTTKGKKHIEIPRKYIQQHVGSTVTLQHVESSKQIADILTKPLNRKVFETLRCELIKEEC